MVICDERKMKNSILKSMLFYLVNEQREFLEVISEQITYKTNILI